MTTNRKSSLLDRSQIGWIHVHHNYTDLKKAKSTQKSTNLISTTCCEEERIRDGDSENGLENLAQRMIKRMNVEAELLIASKVKSYAPHVYHYVFDFEIKPCD